MKFSVNQQDLQKSLNYCQGVIEKRSTLPILSNVLLSTNNSSLIITATDLDLIFINKIKNIEIIEEGTTKTVFEHPRHPYTKALLGAIPYPGATQPQRAPPLIGAIPSPVDLPVVPTYPIILPCRTLFPILRFL